MGKKYGFTLAEVLITLAVIGVVAALAAPVLQDAFQRAKVGPSLRKFKNTMEVATEQLLGDRDVAAVSEVATDSSIFYDAIKKYVQGSVRGTTSEANPAIKTYFGGKYTIANVPTYILPTKDAFAIILHTDAEGITTIPQGSYKGYYADIYYDMNGFDTKPNRLGKDIFVFKMDNSGFLLSYGGKQDKAAYTVETKNEDDKNEDVCTSSGITSGLSCTGTIEDNNWQVTYNKVKKAEE